ncbi:CIA30 family protein [Tenacibaculum sp. Bg11-29]|uniref:CIA30 family protein n=1 Tax=Tenacibaculum sp. Bg11-29 TaxID=2058306 RepID=UPI001E3812B4|nr:CIA30 family protein [Tenacibaculum sp. Bg11-29]
MKWLVLFSIFLCMNDEIIIFDKNNTNQRWYITNDDVMGGISNSSMKLDEENKMIFSGNVSLDNNGGFAMTRLPVSINLDDEKTKLVLKLKGDGKKYQLRIKAKNNQRFWYIQSFQTSKSTEEIELPVHKFYASFRGYKLNVDNFSGAKITEIAILIGNKKKEAFKLSIEKITLK